MRLLLPILLLCSAAVADESSNPPEKPDYDSPTFYMRTNVPEGKTSPRALETTIARFTGKNGLTVDLVAAVHVGDKKYYEQLNTLFKEYDVVLYELVAPEGTRIDREDYDQRKGSNPLGLLQGGMADALGLVHQLEHIDYKAENFVHADLSPEEFARRFGERGDFIQMLIRALLLGMKKSEDQENLKNDLRSQGRVLGAMLAKDPSLPLKRTVSALMIDQIRDGAWVIGGQDGSAIISDRNAACLKKLRAQIASGKKKIAVFYGGAHLPEFARSLEKEFKLRYVNQRWIVAWDLR